MRLLEIVRGKETSLAVIATCMQLAKRLNKVGVLAGNCRGFIGNRMIHEYGREAVFLAEEGAAPEQIDGALYEWGMAMGPLAMGDLAGLDVGWRIRKEFKHLEDPTARHAMVSDALCEIGRYGQKTGAGWYRYDANRKPSPDPVVTELIGKLTSIAGIERREISNSEIIERTIYALVNEGAKILEDGIALRAVDIDIVYLMGYGFPAHRGGPMKYADTVGLKTVLGKIEEFHAKHGKLWTPSKLLRELAEQGKTFAAWDKVRPRLVALRLRGESHLRRVDARQEQVEIEDVTRLRLWSSSERVDLLNDGARCAVVRREHRREAVRREHLRFDRFERDVVG